MDLIKDIKDVSGLEAWLLTQPKDVAVQIAHRAAMRVLPIHWQYSAKQSDSKSLPILRASLISSVADQVPEHVIKAASDGMALADTVAIHGANHTTAAATAAANQRNDFVAHSAAAAYEATFALGKVAQVSAASVGDADADKLGVIAGAHAWQMVRVDAEFLVANYKLRFAPLWANRQNPVQVVWEMVEALLEQEKSDWSFWHVWYQAALDGDPLDPELIKEIATQGEAFWEGTDAEVNVRIAKIWGKDQSSTGSAHPGPSTTVSLSAIRQQILTLQTFLEDQRTALHGINDKGDEANEARINRQITLLVTLIEATDKMLSACDESEPGTALLVIEEQLPVLAEGADEIAETEEAPDISAPIQSMTMTVKFLTSQGWSQKSAERIAMAEYFRKTLRGWFKGR